MATAKKDTLVKSETSIEEWSASDDEDYGLDEVEFGSKAPRLKIVHDEGKFEDSLSGIKYDGFNKAVALGMVRQRVLWNSEMPAAGVKSVPMCRSRDGKVGVPDEDKFPFEKAKLHLADGSTELACASCFLKEWGSNPDSSRKAPWCTEQWVMPMMVDLENDGSMHPVVMTFQGSSVKPVKAFLTRSKRSSQPPFSHFVDISLNKQTRGTVKYSVVEFAQGDTMTASADWPVFRQNFIDIRQYLQSSMGGDSSETGTGEVKAAAHGAAAGMPDLDEEF